MAAVWPIQCWCIETLLRCPTVVYDCLKVALAKYNKRWLLSFHTIVLWLTIGDQIIIFLYIYIIYWLVWSYILFCKFFENNLPTLQGLKNYLLVRGLNVCKWVLSSNNINTTYFVWHCQGILKPHGYIIYTYQVRLFAFSTLSTYCLFIEQYVYDSTMGHICVFFLLILLVLYIMYIKS